MNSYELILIFDPNQGEEKIGAFLAKVEEKIKHLGGAIDKVEKWGTRRLSSMIKKAKALTQGHYVLVRFKSPAGAPAELRSYLKVSEHVVRYFVSRAVVMPVPPVRRGAPGMATAPVTAAVDIGEIKGKPLGEPQ
ncbi:MAG: 30S ribosomal protein S6 [Candidatus Saganbacteria bacterium]|nr:30S ribosomal protein S6 [Candidatus Saganbacteria bacterium]